MSGRRPRLLNDHGHDELSGVDKLIAKFTAVQYYEPSARASSPLSALTSSIGGLAAFCGNEHEFCGIISTTS
jgi:hypothetical protein